MHKVKTAIIAIATAAIMVSALAANAEESGSASVVNINTATVTELTYLPGIGPSKAESIVEHRGKRAFTKVEDLMRVKGIGRQTFKKLQPYLTVKGATTLKAKIATKK